MACMSVNTVCVCFQEDLRTGNKESFCELLVGKRLSFEREKMALWTFDSDRTIVVFCGQMFGLITMKLY